MPFGGNGPAVSSPSSAVNIFKASQHELKESTVNAIIMSL